MTNHRRRTRGVQPAPTVVLGHHCAPALIASVRGDESRLLARCCSCGASAPLPVPRAKPMSAPRPRPSAARAATNPPSPDRSTRHD